jgi:hypothetical protein
MNINNRPEANSIGGGAGAPDEATMVKRALELARMDGRTEPGENDYARAREELRTTGSLPSAPEAGGELENLTTWDTPLDAAGHQSPVRAPDDEANIAEKLVEEGIEEADHHQRVRAGEAMERDEL